MIRKAAVNTASTVKVAREGRAILSHIASIEVARLARVRRRVVSPWVDTADYPVSFDEDRSSHWIALPESAHYPTPDGREGWSTAHLIKAAVLLMRSLVLSCAATYADVR